MTITLNCTSIECTHGECTVVYKAGKIEITVKATTAIECENNAKAKIKAFFGADATSFVFHYPTSLLEDK